MKYVNYTRAVFLVPFRKVKLAVLISTFLFTASLASAGDTVRQTETAQSKRIVKQAERLARGGDFAQAERILRAFLETNPNDSTAKLTLACTLLKQRHIVEAYEISIAIARSEPKNSYAFAVLGTTLLNAGNFRDARLTLINAIKLNNQEALAWLGYGMLEFYENRIPQGLNGLREAVYLEPNEPDYVYAFAQVAARNEKYREAAEAYRTFLRVSPQTDRERRDRIKGLINFLGFLGNRQSLYDTDGAPQTIVSFDLRNDRPIIKIKLDKKGEPLNFVLDTGSGISVVSEETARRLKIKPITRGGLARGIGGEGKFEIVYGFLNSLYLGDVRIRNVPVYIRKFHMNGEQIDGYLGLSLISKYLTTIDYGNRTFALVNQKNFEKQAVEDKALSLPLRLTSSGFLSGEVNLEGVDAPLNFIVDTGASVSVISDELANSKEFSGYVKNEKMRVVGAAGVTENVPSLLLPRVSFGKHSRQSVTAVALDLDLINETSGFEQAGILGGNFLKNFRLTFDFQNSQVLFVPVK